MRSKISVLCVDDTTNYLKLPGLDLWNKDRDAYGFVGTNKVITHAPCQQWSMLKAFAKINAYERLLAYHCFDLVQRNGGIFEHPHGSSFFKRVGVKPTILVDQNHFGFRARKRTALYFKDCEPLPYQMTLLQPVITVQNMDKRERSRMTVDFCRWLVSCVE